MHGVQIQKLQNDSLSPTECKGGYPKEILRHLRRSHDASRNPMNLAPPGNRSAARPA
jgi:hypothetical protein